MVLRLKWLGIGCKIIVFGLFLICLNAPDAQLITVATDNLKDKGIDKGDVLLADPNTPPKPGQLAVEEEEDGKLRVKVANEKRKGGKVLWVLREV